MKNRIETDYFTDFGRIFVASGTLNFFGEGWPYHRVMKTIFPRGFNFDGATLIAKTTTLNRRDGNMQVKSNLQPRKLFPDCVVVNFRKGIALNAVGLSGPGFIALLKDERWQTYDGNLVISFMSVAPTIRQRLEEAEVFVRILNKYLHQFRCKVAIQANASCPNTEHSPADMAKSSIKTVEILSQLGLPVDLKLGVADATVDLVLEIQDGGLCSCLSCSNTIPWGKLPNLLEWEKFFGTKKSPLAKYGGGGLSGQPLFPIVKAWLTEMRSAGVKMPIKAGGGIMTTDNVDSIIDAGADAIELGSVAMLRPWRVSEIINHAHDRFYLSN